MPANNLGPPLADNLKAAKRPCLPTLRCAAPRTSAAEHNINKSWITTLKVSEDGHLRTKAKELTREISPPEVLADTTPATDGLNELNNSETCAQDTVSTTPGTSSSLKRKRNDRTNKVRLPFLSLYHMIFILSVQACPVDRAT